jgi:peptide/nickel transport system substrate-binding protein
MHKRLTLSVAMLVIGVAMLAAASVASAGSDSKRAAPQSSAARKGGTLKFSLFAGIENIDPQRSYYVPEWQYEWLTGRMMLNYAHQTGGRGYRLLNDGARSYTVSRDGKTYTFFLRKGMKLSNGAPITSANYVHTLTRVLNPNVGSPLASFLTDPAAVNIVGAVKYNTSGKGSVSGIRAKGKYALTIKLVKASSLLPTLMALPPTQAEPTNLPMSPITKVNNNLPSGGRYYVKQYVPDRSIKIVKNPFYKPLGAAPTPGNVNEYDYTIGVQQDQAYLLVQKGQLDWAADGLPGSAWSQIFSKYGTKGRARVFPTSVVDYVTMNTSKGVFSNANARKAVAYGIGRSPLVHIRGVKAGFPQCSLLTPAIPGYKKCTSFPLNHGDIAKAKSLAAGHLGDHINFWYTSSTLGTQIQRLATFNLSQIGFTNIDHKPYASGLFSALGVKGNDYDIAIIGWAADFPDAYDYVNKLLCGCTIQDVQNNNTSYFNNGAMNSKMNAASQLRGAARLKAYGNLDNEIMTKFAPLAAIDNRNDREFFSSKVATSSIVTSPIYEIDLGKLALK